MLGLISRRLSAKQSLVRPSEPPREEIGPTPLQVAATALWFGAITGLFELAVAVSQTKIFEVLSYEKLRRNHHYFWMIPVSQLLIFALCGVLLAVAVRFRPRPISGYVFHVLGFLAALCLLLHLPRLYPIAYLALALGIGLRLGRFAKSREEGLRRLVRLSLVPLLSCLSLLTIFGYRQVARSEAQTLASLPAARPGSPNVVLIVLDTVRADHLTPYGYDRDTTPNLDRLARQGVRFAEARSTASWTLPSHASMFTGRLPSEMSAKTGIPLDDTHPTLAEYLAQQGYATAGFVANTYICNAWYGLSRGFARYEDFERNTEASPVEILLSTSFGHRLVTSRLGQKIFRSLRGGAPYIARKDAAMVNADAMEWIDRKPDRPFFLFLNYYDAHGPYVPPAGAPRRYSAGKKADKPEADRDAYDDCLAYLDGQIGKLMQGLEGRGLLENTVVIITSDHGENFGEHGLLNHGMSLYRTELHVPLIVIGPGKVPAGQVVRKPVSLRDLPNTVADLIGRETDHPFPGGSLATDWEMPDRPPRPVLAELDRHEHVQGHPSHVPATRGVMRSLVQSGKKYILNGDGHEELYDLHGDLAEVNNLANQPEFHPILDELREALKTLLD